MKTSRKIALALVGLFAAVVVSVPLVQRLSIELVQLQIREQHLDESLTLPEVSEALGVPYAELVARLPLEGVSDGMRQTGTISEIAQTSGTPLPELKHQIVDAVFSYQFRDADVWNAWGWVSSTDVEARGE